MSGRRWTDEEVAYVREHYHDASIGELARGVGRPRSSVQSLLDRLGLKRGMPPPAEPPRPRRGTRRAHDDRAQREPTPHQQRVEARDSGDDAIDRLRQLRDLLQSMLAGADGRTAAALAREYRATIADIGELEKGAAGDGAADDDALGRLVGEIGRKLSS